MFRSEYAEVPPVGPPVQEALPDGAPAFGSTPAPERVRKVAFVDAVPRAASGKVLRRQPREPR